MTVFTPDLPTDMLVGKPNSDGWIEWKLGPRNREIDPGFEVLEAEVGLQFPETFKLFTSRYFILDGDIGFIRFTRSPSNDPFSHLRNLILHDWAPEQIVGAGLLPFGDWDDGGPICFDTRQPRQDRDWPIVFWDHEGGKISPIIFSNFSKLLECCIYLFSDWPSHCDENTNEVFMKIDPEGAGGPGRKYWSGGKY